MLSDKITLPTCTYIILCKINIACDKNRSFIRVLSYDENPTPNGLSFYTHQMINVVTKSEHAFTRTCVPTSTLRNINYLQQKGIKSYKFFAVKY